LALGVLSDAPIQSVEVGDDPRTLRELHWDRTYEAVGASSVSWYQPNAEQSMRLIRLLGVDHDESIVDVGGGASVLVDDLVDDGFVDITVIDVSMRALDETRARLADDDRVTLIHEDLLAWTPWRTFGLWHDRAVLHFLTEPRERAAYVRTLRAALRPGGAVVIGTFATDGPATCSGLDVARFETGELAELLGGGFIVMAEERAGHTTPQGSVQPFSWIAARREG
jgi:hypothetical protein